jgi:hypothetical protein
VTKKVNEGEKNVRISGRDVDGGMEEVEIVKKGREEEVRVGSVLVRMGGKARLVEGEGERKKGNWHGHVYCT